MTPIANARTQAARRAACAGTRAGSVLLIVLVIVVLLSLGVYTFTELSLAELEATDMHGRAVSARAFAESGIDVALTVLGDGSDHAGESFFHRPDLFQGILLRDSEVPRGRGHFSVCAPVENDTTYSALRFGLINESSKLNVNAIAGFGLNETQAHKLLMPLPGMTDDIADAILDWLDSDLQIRFQGAENEYYEALPQPYRAANGPIGSLDELLLVRGVTPQLLFGEDANRNGWIDPDEDNGDGIPQIGWSAYLTVFSKERNLRPDGSKKINLNEQNLMTLFDQIETEFDNDTAKFIIGFRMSGDKNAPQTQQPQAGGNQNANGQNNNGSGNQGSGSGNQGNNNNNNNGGTSNGGNSNGNNNGGNNNSNSSSSNSNSSNSGGGSNGGGSTSNGGGGTGGGRGGKGGSGGQGGSQGGSGGQPTEEQLANQRGGIDLSAGAKITINSIYDLVDAQVDVTVDGEQTTLDSPWSSAAGALRDDLPKLFETLCTKPDEFIEGRININQARREVLLGLPDVTEAMVDEIIAASPIGADGAPLSEVVESRPTNGWILTEGIVTLPEMRKLDKYLTTQGDIYRLQSVGYYEEGGPTARLEAVIDASQQPPRLMLVRDLTDVGRAYSVDQMLGSAGGR